MRAIHAADNQAEVYMILRVYDVASTDVRMKVYLDPEQLRIDEHLHFDAGSWTVTPL